MFPTIPENPDANTWRESRAQDPVIRGSFDDGTLLQRARYTTVPKRWRFSYTNLPNGSKDLIEQFEETVSFAGSFDWVNPIDNETYTVMFGSPCQYNLESALSNTWNVQVELIEAL